MDKPPIKREVVGYEWLGGCGYLARNIYKDED